LKNAIENGYEIPGETSEWRDCSSDQSAQDFMISMLNVSCSSFVGFDDLPFDVPSWPPHHDPRPHMAAQTSASEHNPDDDSLGSAHARQATTPDRAMGGALEDLAIVSTTSDQALPDESMTPSLRGPYGSVEGGHSRDETSADLIIRGSTTLVVRNIPARYTKEKLLLEWPPDGSYDFLYLPFNFRLGRTAGHAILNFTCNEAALSFYYRWHRQRLSPTISEPKFKIVKAEVQGLEENLRHLVNSKIDRITNPKYVPSVFIRRQEVPFAEFVRNMGIRPM